MTTRQTLYTRAATKALKAIHPQQATLIRAKIALLAETPEAVANNVKALKGSEFSRLRVGDYRVIFTADMVIVTIIKIGHRREIYD